MTREPVSNSYKLANDNAAVSPHQRRCDWQYCTTGRLECGDSACLECYTEAGVSRRYGPPPPRDYGWEPGDR